MSKTIAPTKLLDKLVSSWVNTRRWWWRLYPSFSPQLSDNAWAILWDNFKIVKINREDMSQQLRWELANGSNGCPLISDGAAFKLFFAGIRTSIFYSSQNIAASAILKTYKPKLNDSSWACCSEVSSIRPSELSKISTQSLEILTLKSISVVRRYLNQN